MTTKRTDYSDPVNQLLAIDVAYPLVPTRGVSDARGQLQKLTHADLFGEQAIRDAEMADCCLSGLWLRFDFLDESHTISQSIATSTGSYWHGIMHRREPDWSNAKYWFRKVGNHAIFADLPLAASQQASEFKVNDEATALMNSKTWDPFAFVDLCQQAHRTGGELESFCRAVQLAEWDLLFDWCYRQALGQ